MTLAYQSEPAVRGKTEDGRHLYVFSQSRLKTVDICPERGRRDLLGLSPHTNTDSTAIGTAVHLGIELCLADVIAGQGPWALQDMIDVACDEFDLLMSAETAEWVKAKTPQTAYGAISRCLSTWQHKVLPHLQPWDVEKTFGPMTFYEDDERVIQVQGTVDYSGADGLADWKTASRAWEPWEHQRWDVQPTLYTWADGIHGLGQRESDFDMDESIGWTWHVMQTNGEYQKITTTRCKRDWDWLRQRMVTVAKLLEADLPEWPKNDASALCSPKFCPVWQAGECKGRHFSQTWPK